MSRSLIEHVGDGNLDRVRELLKMGADVNNQDETGCTSLELAVSWERLDIVQELLTDDDIDLNHKDSIGQKQS